MVISMSKKKSDTFRQHSFQVYKKELKQLAHYLSGYRRNDQIKYIKAKNTLAQCFFIVCKIVFLIFCSKRNFKFGNHIGIINTKNHLIYKIQAGLTFDNCFSTSVKYNRGFSNIPIQIKDAVRGFYWVYRIFLQCNKKNQKYMLVFMAEIIESHIVFQSLDRILLSQKVKSIYIFNDLKPIYLSIGRCFRNHGSKVNYCVHGFRRFGKHSSLKFDKVLLHGPFEKVNFRKPYDCFEYVEFQVPPKKVIAPKNLLVAGNIFWSEEFVSRAIKFYIDQGFHVIYKPHPNSKSNLQDLKSKFSDRFEITNSYDVLQKVKYVVASYSSIVFFSILHGCKTTVLCDNELYKTDPLRIFENKLVVYKNKLGPLNLNLLHELSPEPRLYFGKINYLS